MPNATDATLLMMIPLGAVLAFCIWALWGFSNELRAGARQRLRRPEYTHQVTIYAPPQPVHRFSRSHDSEAA